MYLPFYLLDNSPEDQRTSREKSKHQNNKLYRFFHLAKPLILGIGAKLLAGKLIAGALLKKAKHSSSHGSYGHNSHYHHRTLNVNQMNDERRTPNNYQNFKKLKSQRSFGSLYDVGKKILGSFTDKNEENRFHAQCEKFRKIDAFDEITASFKGFLQDLGENHDLCSSKDVFIEKFLSLATLYFKNIKSSHSQMKDNQKGDPATVPVKNNKETLIRNSNDVMNDKEELMTDELEEEGAVENNVDESDYTQEEDAKNYEHSITEEEESSEEFE